MRDIIDIYHALMFQVWAMPEEHARAMIESVIPKLLARDWRVTAERPTGINMMGDPLPVMSINGDCAVIPIQGKIAKDVPVCVKSNFSVADIRDVQDDLTKVQERHAKGEIQRLAFNIDSPGGLASASDELAADIESIRKEMPVLSHFQNLGCSAAYEIAAPSQMITCNEHSVVGNIGSMLVFTDTSEAEAKAGIKTEIFTTGKYKGMGHGPLSDEQRQFLVDQTNAYGERFKNFVRKYRTNVVEADMEGQWFRGEDAVQHGLAHSCQRNLSAAISSFKNLVAA